MPQSAGQDPFFSALANIPETNLNGQPFRRWVVALSGGRDSSCLLHQAKTFLSSLKNPPELIAFHVDHGLSPQSGQWAAFCQQLCLDLSVPCEIARVEVTPESRKGLEQRAREARYQAFEVFLQPTDLLLQAHHQDDQVETFFLRLIRGAGIEGLAGMPSRRQIGKAQLFRPFLDISRKSLKQKILELEIPYIEDPSNLDTSIPRNYLRHEVIPRLKQLQPHAVDNVLAAMSLLAEHGVLLEQLLQPELQSRLGSGPGFSISQDDRQNGAMLAALLRLWIKNLGLQPLSKSQLNSLIETVVFADEDAQPAFEIQQQVFKRYKNNLYCLPLPLPQWPETGEISWNPAHQAKLEIPGVGCVFASGQVAPIDLKLKPRKEAEKICLNPELGSQNLKKLFQQHGLPPWLRASSPLVSCQHKIIAIPELGLFADDCPDALKGKIFFERNSSG